jgi:hypothetical protein
MQLNLGKNSSIVETYFRALIFGIWKKINVMRHT